MKQTPITREMLLELAEAHNKASNFYSDSPDRTYDQAYMALAIMHRDSAKFILDILKK